VGITESDASRRPVPQQGQFHVLAQSGMQQNIHHSAETLGEPPTSSIPTSLHSTSSASELSEDPDTYADIYPTTFAVNNCSIGFKMITCAEPQGKDFRYFVNNWFRDDLERKLQSFLQMQCFSAAEHKDNMETFRQDQGSIIMRQCTLERIKLDYKCKYSFEAPVNILSSSSEMPSVRIVLSNVRLVSRRPRRSKSSSQSPRRQISL